jgi:membrane protein DedA with SNARE-associated domain
MAEAVVGRGARTASFVLVAILASLVVDGAFGSAATFGLDGTAFGAEVGSHDLPPATEDGLTGHLASVRPLLERYGYVAVFAAIFVEGLGIPAPGQTLLIAAALLAAGGALSLPWLLTVAFAASVGGTLVGWTIGRYGGRRILDRFAGPRLEKLEDLCQRRGGLLVAFGRFVDGARQLAGMVSGALGMPLAEFLAWNLVGGLVWTAVWGLGSFVLERNMGAIAELYHRVGPLAAVAILAVLVATVFWLVRGRPRRR